MKSPSFFKRLLQRIFRPRFTKKLIDGKYKITKSFSFQGVDYFHFEDQMKVPAGRQLAALSLYAEMEMCCDKEYLQLHSRAMAKILSNPKKVNLHAIVQLNANLEERMELVPLPDYILRLASVLFFDLNESLYSYDLAYNKKKVARWKKHPDVLRFFLSTPLPELIPSLKTVIENSILYSPLTQKIESVHQEYLSKCLSDDEEK